jgi:replicative DNA helicase
MSLWLFLIKNWKVIIIALVTLVTSAAAAYYIQELRVKSLENRLKAEEIKLKEYEQANKKSQETITKLETEIKKANNLCQKRLAIKDRTIKALKKIDNIHAVADLCTCPVGVDPRVYPEDSSTDEKDTIDPILTELNSLFR